MSIKIYKSIILFILFFHVSFINLPYLNSYGICKYAILLIVGLFMVLKSKIFKYYKFKKINKRLFVYILMVLVSSFMNRNLNIERKVFYVAIVFSVTILEVFFLCEYIIIKKKTEEFIKVLFYLLLFYCLLTDIIIILFPTLHIKNDMYYFIGNKFEVSYLHIQLLIVYLQEKKFKKKRGVLEKKDLIFWILLIISFVTCINVKCTTGMISIFLLIFFYNYFSSKKNQRLKNPKVFIIVLFVSASILILFSNIVKIEFIKYIIEDVFHKDITLTGRLNIYEVIDTVFTKEHIIFGYGMGSSYEVVMKMIGAPNTQNGILEVILQQGIVSLIFLIVLIWKIFKYISKNKSINYSLIILYIYALLTSVEITLASSFLTWLAISLVFEENFKYHEEK